MGDFGDIFIGGSSSTFGYIKRKLKENKNYKALILERGKSEKSLNIGDSYFNNNFIKKTDVSGKIVLESNVFGGSEILDDSEFDLGSEEDYIEDSVYSFENVKKAYNENEFQLYDETHPKTIVYEKIKEKYIENDIDIDYSIHNSYIKSLNNENTTKKIYFKDIIKDYKNIEIVTGCNVKKINYISINGKKRAYSIECILNNEKAIFIVNNEVIVSAGSLSACQILEESDGLVTNKNLGNNINSELETSFYYYVEKNSLNNVIQEENNNSQYYKFLYFFNNTIFIFLFGLTFGCLFNFLYSNVLDVKFEYLRKYFFIVSGIVDGFIIAWIGFNFFWLLSYLFGVLISLIYLFYHGLRPQSHFTCSLLYWTFHISSNILTIYIFNKRYINPGNESLIGLKLIRKYCTQKINTMTNMDYRLIRTYFQNTYDIIVKSIMYLSFIFGIRYLLLNKVLQVKTISRNLNKNGTYKFKNGKWLLDLRVKDGEDLLHYLDCDYKTIDIFKELKMKRLFPLFESSIKDNSLMYYSNIHCQLTGSCRMSDNEEDGVVDKNNGLLVFGTENIRIISLAFYPKTLSGNTSLIKFLFGYITADNK